MTSIFLRSAKKNDIYRDVHGIAAIEFVIVFPILVLLLMGSSVLIEGFRTKRLFERAAFNLVDLATRSNGISSNTARDFYLISKSIIGPAASDPGFTVVLAGAENILATTTNPGLTLTWSCASDGASYLTQEDIDGMKLPEISRGQGLIIAKVTGTFVPTWNLDAIGNFDLEEVSVRRPRFLNTIRLNQTQNTCRLAEDL